VVIFSHQLLAFSHQLSEIILTVSKKLMPSLLLRRLEKANS
jgi:hypothetical protein